jgi:3-oxoacyl-[acyl-carrier protein] reductase
MKLAGKVAFITGASSGIGAEIARLFAAEGAKVAVIASSDLHKANVIADAIRDAGGHAWAGVVDVRNRTSVESGLDAAAGALGAIDIVVNAAGVYYATPIGATSVDAMDRMVDINLKGTFNVINAIVPRMMALARGKIVNFSSVAAVTGVRERSLYCATKAAIAQMTKALARELAPHGINCNAIAPGNTATPMNEKVRADPKYAVQLAGMIAATPSRTPYSDPKDMAKVALFLACDDSVTLHGALLVADEGISTGLG